MCTAIDITQCLANKPHTKFREVQNWSVEFAGNQRLKAAMERHPAMLHQNNMNRFLPRQQVTAKNHQSYWRCNSAGACLSNQHRLPAPEPLRFLHGMPTSPPAQSSQINNLQHGYNDLPVPLPGAPCFNLDACA